MLALSFKEQAPRTRRVLRLEPLEILPRCERDEPAGDKRPRQLLRRQPAQSLQLVHKHVNNHTAVLGLQWLQPAGAWRDQRAAVWRRLWRRLLIKACVASLDIVGTRCGCRAAQRCARIAVGGKAWRIVGMAAGSTRWGTGRRRRIRRAGRRGWRMRCPWHVGTELVGRVAARRTRHIGTRFVHLRFKCKQFSLVHLLLLAVIEPLKRGGRLCRRVRDRLVQRLDKVLVRRVVRSRAGAARARRSALGVGHDAAHLGSIERTLLRTLVQVDVGMHVARDKRLQTPLGVLAMRLGLNVARGLHHDVRPWTRRQVVCNIVNVIGGK